MGQSCAILSHCSHGALSPCRLRLAGHAACELVCPPRHGQIKTRSPLHPTASSSSHRKRTCLHYTTIAIRCLEEISIPDSPPVTPGSVVAAGFSLRLPSRRIVGPAPISRSGQAARLPSFSPSSPICHRATLPCDSALICRLEGRAPSRPFA